MADTKERDPGGAGQGGLPDRLVEVRNLLDAIAACDWEDAEMIMSAVLEEARADAPRPPFGQVEDDAEFWARMATFEELRAYFIACGKRLVRQQLGRRGKIRLAMTLIADMPEEDRRAVIASSTGAATGRVIQPNDRRAEGHRR